MSVTLAKNWWSLVIRGLTAIVIGVITVLWSDITTGQLVLVFFAYAMIDGLVGIAGAVRAAEQHERWGSLLSDGLVGIVAAVVAVAWPGISNLSLLYVIAAWAIASGGSEIAAALRLRQSVLGEWLLGSSGIASFLLGILLIAIALATPLSIAYWLGAYAFVFGALLIALGLRLRSWVHTFGSGTQSSLPQAL